MKRHTRVLAGAALAVFAACRLPPGESPSSGRSEAIPPPPKAIPKNAPLGKDAELGAARLAWARRVFLDSYDRVGVRSPKCDADARKLIADSLPAVFAAGDPGDAAARATLGKSLYQRECRDPLVLYFTGRAIFDAVYDAVEPAAYYAAAVEGMKTVPYPRAVARHVATELYDRYNWRAASKELREPVRQLELQWFQASLSEGSYGPDDDMVLAWQLQERAGLAFFYRTSFRSTAVLGSAAWLEPWTKHLFLGLRHHDEAWWARGGDFASAVKRGDWPRFEAFSKQARQDLVESWRLDPGHPEAASTMIQVALDLPEPGETSRLWFDRAVAAQLDYAPAYERLTWVMRPRWGGSYDEMLAFAEEIAETGRFDTDVPLHAVEAVMDAYADQADKEAGAGGVPVYERPRAYALVTSVLGAYLKEPSQAAHKARFEALWAVAADQAGKAAEALSHLDSAGGRLTKEACDRLDDESLDQFVARVTLNAGPGGAAALRARSLHKAGDVAGALAGYREALGLDRSPHAVAAATGALETLETEQAAAKGDWAPFLPSNPTLDAWVNFYGNWKVGPGPVLVGMHSARGLYLYSRAHIPDDFEIRGSFEATTKGAPLEAGVIFGPSGWSDGLWPALSVSCDPERNCVAFLSKGFGEPVGEVVPLAGSTLGPFLIRVQKGRLSATIAGQPVFTERPLEDGWRSDSEPLQVGFGGRSTGAPRAVRFSKVEIRGLKSS